eukprot:gene1392-1839_t
MYGAVLTTADMVTSSGTRLDLLILAETDRYCAAFVEKIFKPFILLPLAFLIIIPTVTVYCIFQTSLHIIFNAMVLWRAYKRLENLDFVHFLTPYLKEMSRITHSEYIIYVLSYPIVKFVDSISDIKINLSAVQVTCPGAQSPLYLLADLIIVGVVIIIIESDVHVFWTMMISPAMGKIRSSVFNRHYFFGHIFSTGLYMWLASLISYVPDPSKLVQYCMGFVVLKGLFNYDKAVDSWVPFSANCDGAIPLGGGRSFPIDSILANLAGILAILVLPAVIYLLSSVLFGWNDSDAQKRS